MFSTIGFNTAKGAPAGTMMIIAGVWIFVNIPLSIGVLLATLIERTKYKQQSLPIPKNNYSRTALKLVSNWLLILCSLWFSMSFMPDASSKPIIMLFAICLIWSVVTALYAHCPKQYKRVKVGENIIVKRNRIAIAGLAVTAVFLIVMFAWIISVTA